ncbi:MAG: HD domain-containing phosphohydrolase, partial [Angelakisella sp.]
DEILNVPRKLTISEFEVVKMHTVFSYELLSMDEKFAEQIRLAALYHHEKMNGSGYPKRLVADQIPQYAKITAVSDIYDAMVSQRSYKAANNPFAIISRLASQQFSELDMQLVRLFTQHMPVELMGKPCLMSDGSIGIIRCLMPGAPEYPLVEINGNVTKTDEKLYCKRMILEE